MNVLRACALSAILLPARIIAQDLDLHEGGVPRSYEEQPGETGIYRGEELPVLYEKDQARSAQSRRLVTRRIAVRLRAGSDPFRVATDHGLRAFGAKPYAPEWRFLETTNALRTLAVVRALRKDPRVEDVRPLLARQAAKRFVPNDPLFTNQWHLLSGATPGLDVRVTNVWDTFRGSNIVIGIVDDGLQTAHPDLAPNVNTNIDFDWNDASSNDPNPSLSVDFHGTACAGVAAARGNNGVGVSGAAPEATLVGLRLIGGPATDEDEADAMMHSNALIHIKSNSWGPTDGGSFLEGPGPLMASALSNAAASGRGGKGTILVWAGGNGRDADDDANLDGYANSIYTIAVGAIGPDGLQSWYSDPGACLVVSAPSNGDAGDPEITTTDLSGANGYNSGGGGDYGDNNYTKTFGGTSSATPLAAGVVALLLQANTNLGWRDVQEILIRSATQVDPGSSDWKTNSAGFRFNHGYGAGMVNARDAVTLALTWTNLGAWVSTTEEQTNINAAIPDNNTGGVTRTFFIGNDQRVEHVAVEVDITHIVRRNLQITLTAPSGMKSTLIGQAPKIGAHYADWTFTTVRHWGESMQGTWTLRVADLASGFTGTLHSARLTFYGSPVATNSPPVLAPTGDQFVQVSNLLQVSVSAMPTEGDSVTLSASNLPSGATFSATNENGTLSFTPTAAQVGVYTSVFYATDNDGVDQETVTITVVPIPQSEGSNVLVYFDFDNGGLFEEQPQFAAAGVSASAMNTADGSWTTNSGNPATGKSMGDTGWTAANYFTFTMTVTNGYAAQITGLDFDDTGSASGPTSWVIRHSFDNFAGTAAQGAGHSSFTTNSAAFAIGPVTGAITLRIIGTNASSGTGVWRIDNVRLFGSVTPLDTDGDGVIDIHEGIAGTDPTNALSFFAADMLSVATNGIIVTWQSVSNRIYAVSMTTNLPGQFIPVAINVTATPPVNTFIDSNATNEARFYRIEL